MSTARGYPQPRQVVVASAVRRWIFQGVKRGRWADRPEVLQAYSRHGVIRVQTLETLGVPSMTAYRRCRPEGPWRRLLPGVVVLHNGRPTRLQAVSAALLYAGERAVITGLEACRRHGLRQVPDEPSIHVLVPDDRKLKSCGFVLVERTTRLPVASERSGIPLAPVTRALLDACRRIPRLNPSRALISEAVQRRMTTRNDLAVELAAGSSRGSALPRRVLSEIARGADSVAEVHGQRLWRRSGLPEASWNGRLHSSGGAYIATPDAWIDDVGFAWEIDSVAHHSAGDGFAQTLARNARYAAAGVVVLQTLPARIQTDPEGVIRELRAAYAAATARPRPPVIFHPRDHGAATERLAS